MIFDKQLLAPAGSTGNNTHPGVAPHAEGGVIGLQFVVEAVGGTPTVTFKYQGSMDGTNWFDVAYVTTAADTLATTTQAVTATGATLNFLESPTERQYSQFRVVTSANTNVTYRAEMYTQSTD